MKRSNDVQMEEQVTGRRQASAAVVLNRVMVTQMAEQ
jgi:hypothetical protein